MFTKVKKVTIWLHEREESEVATRNENNKKIRINDEIFKCELKHTNSSFKLND